jgi:hypothetical protein
VLPFVAGIVHVTIADASPGVTIVMVGAPGAPTGVTAFDVPAALVPTALVAVTLNVYAVPFVRFVMLADVPLMTMLPSFGTTETA